MTENNNKIQSAAISDKGLSEKRPQNEDSFLEMNARGLFAVADGVGGAQAGDVASQMAVEQLSEAFNNLKVGGDAEELMKVAIERANQSIYQMSHDLTELATMATTVVALHVAGNIATIGHVGDSRLYRLDAKGNLYRETQDHSVVEEEVRAGRMTETQAANHPSRNIISRALGADFTVEVDMKTIMFEPNTTFLLCSDGITRHITDEEIRALLTSNDALAGVAQKMKEICYERGAEDNLTAVIVKSSGAAAEISTAKKAAGVHDYEEQTIATARAANAAADTAPLEKPSENLPTDAAQTSEIISNSTVVGSKTIPLVRDTAPLAAEENIQNVSTANQSVETNKINVPATENKIETEVKSYRVSETEESGSSGKLGKILSTLLWLIIGGLAGAGLYHLFLQNNKPPEAPPVLVRQSDNIDLTAFENNRRRVDDNPQQFLAANTAPPEDAEDYYLLGRADLYSGKFPEAKQMFTEAKNRLAQTGEVNSKVLANDIETGLLIVEVPFAQDEFKKRMNLNRTDVNSQETNLNTNQSTENKQP